MNQFILAAADNNQEIMDFLQKFQDWIQHANIWTWIWQNVVWAFVRGLYTLSSLAEKSVDTILNLGGFLDYGPIQTIYLSMQVIAASIVGIMLIVVGYKKMFNSPVKLKRVTIQTVMVFCLMVELPGLMTWGLDISKQFFNESKTAGNTNPGNSSLSFALIKDNTTDLAFVASNDFKALEEGSTIINAPGQSGVVVPEKNTLTEEMFKQIPMSDVITPKDADKLEKNSEGERGAYLGYQLTYDYDGKLEASKIDNGFLDMFKEGVFRYPAQFPTIIMGLITLGLAYLMALFVIAQSMVELAFKKILFPLVAASDIETGQRTKVYLQDIFQTLMVIPLTGISLRVFTIYYAFVATLGLNWFLFSIASIVGMFVCMNGANTIAKHFGIDVGVKDGMKGMLMMMAAGKLGKDVVSGTGKTAKKVANKGLEATESGFEQAKKSIRDTKDTVNKGSQKLGENMGHLSERGVSGFMTDKKEAMKESALAKKEEAKESLDSSVSKATKPIKDVKDNFTKGVDSGIVEGATKNATKNGKANEPTSTIRDSVRNEDNPQQKGYGKVNPGKEQSFGNDQNNKGETNQFGNTKVSVPKNSESEVKGVSKSLSELKVDGSVKGEGKSEGGHTISTAPTESKQDTLKAKLENTNAIQGNSPSKIEVIPPGTPNLNVGTMASNTTTTEGKSVTGNNGTTQQQVTVKNENQVKQDVQQVTNQNTQVSENYQTTNQNHTKQETTQSTHTTNNNNQTKQLVKDNYHSVNTSGKSSSGQSKNHGEFTVNFDNLFNGKE